VTGPETSPAALEILLFGPMQVRVHGKPLPRLRSRKGLWLLALLTLRHDRPVEREWLVSMLWPDLDQRQGFANLRPVLSELRGALGNQAQRLQSPDQHTLFLELTGVEADVVTFDAAIARKTLSALEQAVARYCGPLLEGCNEEWVFQERAVREENCLQALQQLADASVTVGDYAQAFGYYRRAVGLDPWSEAARRGLMEALSRSGDTNAALQVYQEFVAVLRSDPTALPDEKTSALYQRLRSEARHRAGAHPPAAPAAAPAPKVQGYLPHPLTDLVGREDERMEVILRLRRSRLVTLTGLGGIGKTRLAREVAGEVVAEYSDGVWLVALEALSEGRLVVQQIASVLGLKEEPGRMLLHSVTEHLRTRRILLVLDNCEHLLKASAQAVADLLRECGELRILATSREALGITGEAAWSVPALAVPDTEHLPEGRATLLRVLMSYESVQLFVERAQGVQKSFVLNESNARPVAQVCRQLEGMPLAIELAAARVKAMTVERIASRLDDYLGLLTGGSPTMQRRQQTLRATLDWSYDLLTKPERSLLRRLSVFTGGWTLEAAEGVCDGEGIDTSQILNLLTSLVDKSLIVFEERERDGGGRYRMLEMVRKYAAESLQASAETGQVRSKHRDYFLALAEEVETQLKGAAQGAGLARLEREHENLREALEWCRIEKDGAPAGLRLAGALGRFWEVRGYPAEGRRYLLEALAREASAERTPERARALNRAGVLAWRQGDYPAAMALHEQSLAIQRELGDKRGIVLALHELGNVVHLQGDYLAARMLHEESLAISRELEDSQGIADSLDYLGNVSREQGDYETARVFYAESLAISRELKNRGGIAWLLNQMGSVSREQGDYETARAYFEESLAISRELGDKWGIAWSLNRLGNVAREQSDYLVARMLHQESLTISRELGDRRGIAWALCSLGNVDNDQGNSGSARSLYKESLSIHGKLGDRRGVTESLEGMAAVMMAQSETQQAVRLWGAAHVLRERIGAPLPLRERKKYDQHLEQACSVLGEDAFSIAWEGGHAMTWEQAVTYARKEPEPSADDKDLE
jgi:predicted ATPase/DNA-binding SARP family transcriptional activator